jgi:ribonuclease R
MIGKVKKASPQQSTSKKAKTFVYRIHDQPDPQKLESLRQVVAPFGYKLKTGGTRSAISRSLNALMDEAAGSREQKLIETVALRAMMKAKYSTHNIGHYGLAFDYYTHFTSPIRRYPDTMVHRLLTRYQDGGRSANQEHYEELCDHSSDMEQTAQQAERDSIKYKMVEFMADKIGNHYDGHISGIQSYGIYVEIDENHCEGLVSMHDLKGDYYEFDEAHYQLIGRRHHTKYQLGDPIRIQVARANIEKRQLDFILSEE